MAEEDKSGEPEPKVVIRSNIITSMVSSLRPGNVEEVAETRNALGWEIKGHICDILREKQDYKIICLV